MSAPDYVLVDWDDWQVLYCNGEAVLQGHSIPQFALLEEVAPHVKMAEGKCNDEGEALDYWDEEKTL